MNKILCTGGGGVLFMKMGGVSQEARGDGHPALLMYFIINLRLFLFNILVLV